MGWGDWLPAKKLAKTGVSKAVTYVTEKAVSEVAAVQFTTSIATKALDLDTAPSVTAASIPAPASPAPATLPLETVDVPTASYLEMVEDQAIKQQKALAGQIKSAGFVSEQQAQELAMAGAEKPADLTWVIIVSVLGLVLFGRKLWR